MCGMMHPSSFLPVRFQWVNDKKRNHRMRKRQFEASFVLLLLLNVIAAFAETNKSTPQYLTVKVASLSISISSSLRLWQYHWGTAAVSLVLAGRC